MASSPIPALKVLEQSTVSPPNSSVPETSIPLSFCDLMWLNLNNVERIFFYSIPAISTSHFVKHLLPSLKTSLSLTLQHFFPLAGHVIFSPNSDCGKFQYQYKDGDSISFTVAESDRDFTHLAGDDARSVIELESFVPTLAAVSADATPLMAVQVTVFPSQGICLGLTINHGACAYVWTCQVWARGLPSNQVAWLGFLVNAKRVGEILGRVIDGLGDGVLRDVVDAWVEMGKIVKYERPLLVLGSPGFRFYDSDFGCGRPVKVEVVSLKNTEAMSISEGKGGGGIGIGMTAPKMEMEMFSFEFAEGLDQLLHSF
ncbi:hypothetical protein J5N97_023015 [Dioscorea zingiberensis]|uniref:Uncharacterized protein n=1 Tax=Dioscorea zingiberensis TaxID=325984 RepID=A0A9D5CBI0_9LILI|nr:hypothetical protein J5N97_023015 [Dioscorea zingiberensis]